MTSTYAIIEGRIQKAIDVINTRENSNRAEIAREFRVSYERLRSRLKNYQFKTAVRELHNRALKPDQKSALRQYLIKLNQLDLSARLHMMQLTANALRAQDFSR
jgi:(p)ppGpp synthase/HD superfamily hydrolase